MKSLDIVTLGELLMDMFPDKIGRRIGEVEAFLPRPGGAPANVAAAARRLGKNSAFIGKVGDDQFGHHLRDVLFREGVNTTGIKFDQEARTTMAIIALPDENSPEFIFYRNPGADQRLTVDDLELDLLKGTKAFHFGSLSLSDEPVRSATYQAAKTAKDAGALISFDVNYRPALWNNPFEALDQAQKVLPDVDLLKVNEIEAELLSGYTGLGPHDLSRVEKALDSLLEKGPTLVVLTFGPEGSYFKLAGGGGYVPPFKVETIDSVGCGDAFTAGLLVKLVAGSDWRSMLSQEQLQTSMYYANAVGALKSTKSGAIPGMPNLKEVEYFLENNKPFN